ncbi:MAG: NAD(P)/FAD-dependent oxidoreductase [Acidiferrobacterales bacterium]
MTKAPGNTDTGIPGEDEVIEIAGAGPSGLTAAIILAHAGRKVLVHELHKEVGYRFGRDLQGLENWTTEQNVLEALTDLGITTDFEKLACRSGILFDSKDRVYEINDKEPLFYLVERGPGQHSLDTALLNQARDLGAEVRFNSRVKHLEGAGILATGPKAADAIAVGYHFDTDMDNGFWAICDNNLAPQGYAYLLVMNGRGTIKTCMFTNFKQEKVYVARTVAAFERLVDLRMKNQKPHGGVGNFRIPKWAMSGKHPVVGEQAGFQDTLWGFGMRYAIRSGALAANSLIEGTDYEELRRDQIDVNMKIAIVNRGLYTLLGNPGYRTFMRMLANSKNIRASLRKQYQPNWFKLLFAPLALLYFKSRRKDKNCHHVNCTCVWCRCGGAT